MPILVLAQHDWDHEQMRPAVREAFRKVLDCGTAALGAEVFASDNEERVVYHTCKSRACPSCGYRATTLWQRDQWRELPDTPYAHISFTMPDVLWPLFRQNRHLLHDLPVLGAKVIEHWAFQTYGVRLMILVGIVRLKSYVRIFLLLSQLRRPCLSGLSETKLIFAP